MLPLYVSPDSWIQLVHVRTFDSFFKDENISLSCKEEFTLSMWEEAKGCKLQHKDFVFLLNIVMLKLDLTVPVVWKGRPILLSCFS